MIVNEYSCKDCNAIFEELASSNDLSCLFCGSTNIEKTSDTAFKGASDCSSSCDHCSGCC